MDNGPEIQFGGDCCERCDRVFDHAEIHYLVAVAEGSEQQVCAGCRRVGDFVTGVAVQIRSDATTAEDRAACEASSRIAQREMANLSRARRRSSKPN